MNWLKIRRTLHHASRQRLSHWLGAHPVRFAASTSIRLQRNLTFLIWHFPFRLCCDAALSVSDSCLGGPDLASILVTIHAARLRHWEPTSASSRPLRSRSSTQVLCCSEFLHFCLIFHCSFGPLILNPNILVHMTELKNRPPLVDAAHQGLSNALPGLLCSPATANLSWRYFCISNCNFQQLYFKVWWHHILNWIQLINQILRISNGHHSSSLMSHITILHLAHLQDHTMRTSATLPSPVISSGNICFHVSASIFHVSPLWLASSFSGWYFRIKNIFRKW